MKELRIDVVDPETALVRIQIYENGKEGRYFGCFRLNESISGETMVFPLEGYEPWHIVKTDTGATIECEFCGDCDLFDAEEEVAGA